MKIFGKIAAFSLFILLAASSINAIEISGWAPKIDEITVTILGIPTTFYAGDTEVEMIQQMIDDNFELAKETARNELSVINDQPKLARGFANANAYAAQAATHQGYQDYSLFAVTSGIMIGAQLPSSDRNYYDNIGEKIKNDGDIYAGLGTGLAYFNIGINAGFIYPDLFLGVKFGQFSMKGKDVSDVPKELEESTFKSMLIGISANYSLLRTKSLLFGLLKWRGVSLGTGFLYNKNEMDINIDFDEIIQPITNVPILTYTLTGEIIINPTVNLGIHSTTYTIPFDVSTSVRLLWLLNVNLGIGVDLNFGSTDIIIKGASTVDAEFTGVSEVTMEITPGNFAVDGSTKNKKPSFMHHRVTTGIGINILPIKIDVPIIIYPFDSAAAVGLTVGVVW